MQSNDYELKIIIYTASRYEEGRRFRICLSWRPETDENGERLRRRRSLRDHWQKQPDYIPGRVRNVAQKVAPLMRGASCIRA
jgi:hypothetical protein